MKTSDPIESQRLILRKVELDDWLELHSSVCDDRFPSTLPLALKNTPKLAQNWVEDQINNWNSGVSFTWTVIDKQSVSPIGQITISNNNDTLMLAYWISPKFWRKGYAYEACLALLNKLRHKSQISRICAGSAQWNHSSAKLLQKIGFIKSDCKEIEMLNGVIEQVDIYLLDLAKD